MEMGTCMMENSIKRGRDMVMGFTKINKENSFIEETGFLIFITGREN